MKRVWHQNNNEFYPSDDSTKYNILPVGIYIVSYHPQKGFYLSKTQDNFKFNYKIYNKDEKFIKIVTKSYENLTENLGILLTGLKGTGKSVTSKLICNELNLPVICITTLHDNIDNFLTTIQQPVIIFIDEYEKIYQDGSDLLSLIDGMLKNDHKNVFLLTTNSLYINENLLQRPGRIRYVKEYKDLEIPECYEIIDDLLKYPEFKEDCIDSISKLPNLTIDLVKEIINEINIHNVSPKEFIDIFNVRNNDYDHYNIGLYDVYEINGTNSNLVQQNVLFNTRTFYDFNIGYKIHDKSDNYYGQIIEMYPTINRVKVKYYYDSENDRNHYYKEVNTTEVTKILEFKPSININRMFNII